MMRLSREGYEMSKSVYIELIEMENVSRQSSNQYKYTLSYDAPAGFSIERVEHDHQSWKTWYVVMVPDNE